MVTNQMLGKKKILDEKSNLQSNKYDEHKELVQCLKDFKLELNAAFNLIDNFEVRGRCTSLFYNNMINLENKVHALVDDQLKN